MTTSPQHRQGSELANRTSFDVPLRWVDLDAQGHVNNSTVVDYLQEGRVRFFLASAGTRDLTAGGLVVVAHQVEYLAPIDFSTDPVRVEVGIESLGGSKITLGYDVTHDGQPVAKARSLLCAFDFARNRPRRLSVEQRDALGEQRSRFSPMRDIGAYEVGSRFHSFPFRVRWSDQDINGHVNNVRFYDYVAEARITMTSEADHAATRTSAAVGADYLWLIARQDMEYLRQLQFRPEPYEVRTAVGRVGRTSLTLVAEIHDPLEGALCARAHTVLVCADRSGSPTALPKSLIAHLEPFHA